MRQIISLIATAGLLGTAAGCCHTAGRCDCELLGHPANCHYYQCGYGHATQGGKPSQPAETLKEVPRPLDKDASPPKKEKEVRLPAEQGMLPASLDDAAQPGR